nr:lisH domain-containing protein C1711.05-like [Ipomoea trifida]
MAEEEEVTSQNQSSNYSSESVCHENPREAFEKMMKSFYGIEDSHLKLKEENAKLLAERQDLEDLKSKNDEMLESISQLEKQVLLLKEECKSKDDREQNLRADLTLLAGVRRSLLENRGKDGDRSYILAGYSMLPPAICFIAAVDGNRRRRIAVTHPLRCRFTEPRCR